MSMDVCVSVSVLGVCGYGCLSICVYGCLVSMGFCVYGYLVSMDFCVFGYLCPWVSVCMRHAHILIHTGLCTHVHVGTKTDSYHCTHIQKGTSTRRHTLITYVHIQMQSHTHRHIGTIIYTDTYIHRHIPQAHGYTHPIHTVTLGCTNTHLHSCTVQAPLPLHSHVHTHQ